MTINLLIVIAAIFAMVALWGWATLKYLRTIEKYISFIARRTARKGGARWES